ncbi:hypothetical protein EYF80_045565 [Liparis tanakae]|uniref:Uncharacterized protein n=1 Tax=Liparis tanakae TaxID=230148 RepID=A0A4Z2FSN0_9TELE|nr:hypothetical protein EYF80_045565 [Liparis tanakae]
MQSTDDQLVPLHARTLTAEHAILHVTEDSSFRVLWSNGTKSTRDTGLPAEQRPAVYVVACFGERGLYDGRTEDGRGPSDLGVPVLDEAQHSELKKASGCSAAAAPTQLTARAFTLTRTSLSGEGGGEEPDTVHQRLHPLQINYTQERKAHGGITWQKRLVATVPPEEEQAFDPN